MGARNSGTFNEYVEIGLHGYKVMNAYDPSDWECVDGRLCADLVLSYDDVYDELDIVNVEFYCDSYVTLYDSDGNIRGTVMGRHSVTKWYESLHSYSKLDIQDIMLSGVTVRGEDA